MNRRGFLKLSGVAALVLAGGSVLAMRRAGARYRAMLPPGAAPSVLTEKELAVLCAVCDRLLPGGSPTAREARVAERIDRELAFHGPRLQSDVKLAILLVEHGGWTRLSPTRFTARDPDAQDAWLEHMQNSDGLMAQAFAGLREIAMFFYYCDERAWPRIHYEGPLVSMPSKPEADSALVEKRERKG
jgi:hypothetical protein